MLKQEKKTYSEANMAIRRLVKKIKRDRHFNVAKKDLTYKEFLANRMLIVHAIREGIPYSLFNYIKHNAPFSETDWADFLNISTKSLQRYSNIKGYTFKPIHTEKIIELAEVTSLGEEVFDSSDQFYLWLNTPCFALGNLKPVELLKDSYGKEMVINELDSIDQGIFA